METSDYKGIRLFVLAALKEHQLYLSLFVCLFIRCVVPLSVHYRLCLVIVRMESNAKRETCQIFKEYTLFARVERSICKQTATSFCVSSAAVPKLTMTHTNHGKTSSAEPEPSKRERHTLNSIESKYHKTNAAKVTYLLSTYLLTYSMEQSPS
jgi:hypothetical protein